MNEEDEAFNEIERRSIAKKEAVKATVNAEEALTKLLIESYDQGVKDALESVTQAIKPQRTWVGLTVEEIEAIGKSYEEKDRSIQAWGLFASAIEAKLKEKNT